MFVTLKAFLNQKKKKKLMKIPVFIFTFFFESIFVSWKRESKS